MKAIAEQYGGVIVTIIAMIAVLFIFIGNGNGLIHRFQKVVDTPSIDYSDYADAIKTDEILQKADPVITVSTTVKQNVPCDLYKLFQVTSADGNPVSYEVISVKDTSGSDITATQDLQQYIFAGVGRYTVGIVATDENGITIKKDVSLVVQN